MRMADTHTHIHKYVLKRKESWLPSLPGFVSPTFVSQVHLPVLPEPREGTKHGLIGRKLSRPGS